jgi:hypothetical protein
MELHFPMPALPELFAKFSIATLAGFLSFLTADISA